jgi:hypothetical protein
MSRQRNSAAVPEPATNPPRKPAAPPIACRLHISSPLKDGTECQGQHNKQELPCGQVGSILLGPCCTPLRALPVLAEAHLGVPGRLWGGKVLLEACVCEGGRSSAAGDTGTPSHCWAQNAMDRLDGTGREPQREQQVSVWEEYMSYVDAAESSGFRPGSLFAPKSNRVQIW